MNTRIKDSPQEGRLTRIVPLALVVVMLIGSSFYFRPTAAAPPHAAVDRQHATTPLQAQDTLLTRLEMLGNINDGSAFRFLSDDNGVSWSEALAPPDNDQELPGAPALVSDGVGRLTMFSDIGLNAMNKPIKYSTFSDGFWHSLTAVPGSFCIGNACYAITASPAASSWGPGRFDVFVNGTNTTNGSIALLHTWADNSTWVGHWEVLGTGLMQGGPTAVSWGPGRIDVFVRGGGNELSHKWFDNGHWSSGWEDLGGTMTSSPSVSSPFSGAL